MGKFQALTKKPRLLATLIIGLIVLAAIGLGVHNLNGPAQGTVTTPLSDATETKNTSGLTPYTDKYVSFNYPSRYIQGAVLKDPGYLDAIKLIKAEHRDQYATVGILRETLASDSGVHYRSLHPELYKVISSPSDSVIFAKLDQTEYTGFIQHGDKVISISFIAVSPTDMGADYKTIADSLKWQQ